MWLFVEKASGRQVANPRCGKLMRNSSFDFYTAVVVITLLYSVRGEDKDKTRSTYGGTVTFTTSSLSEPVEVSSNLVKPSSPSALSDIADSSSSNPAEPDALPVPISTLPKPVVRSYDSPTSSVQWMTLLKGSMSYLGVMHSFRLGTEAGTREALNNGVVGDTSSRWEPCMVGRTAMAIMRTTW